MNIASRSPIIAPAEPEPGAIAEMLDVRVTETCDGDGFFARIRHPRRDAWVDRVPFRFAFIDAPELAQPFGREAKAFLGELVEGKNLNLILIGKESTGYRPVDRYQRLLCMGFLTEEAQAGRVDYYLDGQSCSGLIKAARQVTRNIELELIANGLAWAIQQYSFDLEDEYRAAQDDARRHRRGLWAEDRPEPPWTFKRKQRRQGAADQRQPSLF